MKDAGCCAACVTHTSRRLRLHATTLPLHLRVAYSPPQQWDCVLLASAHAATAVVATEVRCSILAWCVWRGCAWPYVMQSQSGILMADYSGVWQSIIHDLMHPLFVHGFNVKPHWSQYTSDMHSQK